jgi:antitoxin (DNA-binding transcriptional repressor) of toxin-antitoxin stability system
MPDVTATEASRRFADLLDGVEHRGERYTIIRRGHVVAELAPVHTGSGSDVKALLRRHDLDGECVDEVATLRKGLATQERY